MYGILTLAQELAEELTIDTTDFSEDRKTGEMKTGGLIGAITKIMDRRNKKYSETHGDYRSAMISSIIELH